jgi:hypothetical protein
MLIGERCILWNGYLFLAIGSTTRILIGKGMSFRHFRSCWFLWYSRFRFRSPLFPCYFRVSFSHCYFSFPNVRESPYWLDHGTLDFTGFLGTIVLPVGTPLPGLLLVVVLLGLGMFLVIVKYSPLSSSRTYVG